MVECLCTNYMVVGSNPVAVNLKFTYLFLEESLISQKKCRKLNLHLPSASITELSSCDIFIRVCSYKNIQQSRVSVTNIIISLRITEVKIENTEFYINTIRCLLLKNLLT